MPLARCLKERKSPAGTHATRHIRYVIRITRYCRGISQPSSNTCKATQPSTCAHLIYNLDPASLSLQVLLNRFTFPSVFTFIFIRLFPLPLLLESIRPSEPLSHLHITHSKLPSNSQTFYRITRPSSHLICTPIQNHVLVLYLTSERVVHRDMGYSFLRKLC